MTGREMCEYIIRAGILQKRDGSELTWEDIWYYSSTGELFMVFQWFREAQFVLEPEVAMLRTEKEMRELGFVIDSEGKLKWVGRARAEFEGLK